MPELPHHSTTVFFKVATTPDDYRYKLTLLPDQKQAPCDEILESYLRTYQANHNQQKLAHLAKTAVHREPAAGGVLQDLHGGAAGVRAAGVRAHRRVHRVRRAPGRVPRVPPLRGARRALLPLLTVRTVRTGRAPRAWPSAPCAATTWCAPCAASAADRAYRAYRPCAARLAECPVCRHYVVRAVRCFRC
ncbi:hypothetical protein ACJJTC_007636 [Scirpophaga incertulas]